MSKRVRGQKTPDGQSHIDILAEKHEGVVYISTARVFDGLRSPFSPTQARRVAAAINAAADYVDSA